MAGFSDRALFPTSPPYDRRIYAPFTRMRLQEVGNGTIVETGFLKEGSKLAVKDIYVGPDYDRRRVGSEIEIVGFDADADFDNEFPFFPFVNKQVYVYFFCYGGGGFMDGPFRYHMRQEHLEGLGMHYVHVVTGRTRWLPWLTFEDSSGAWSEFLQVAGIVV